MGIPILVRHLYIETAPIFILRHVLERVKITHIEKGVHVYLVELKYFLGRGNEGNKKIIVDIDMTNIYIYGLENGFENVTH